MTLEEDINNLRIDPQYVPMGADVCYLKDLGPIEEWDTFHIFGGIEPRELQKPYVLSDTTVGTRGNLIRHMKTQVDKMIRAATLVECLTSPSEYIREYRKEVESE